MKNELSQNKKKHYHMRIFIKTSVLNPAPENTIQLDVEQNTDVYSVKYKILEITGVYAELQRLIFLGKELFDDYKSMQDYGIYDQCTLYLVRRNR